jgi:hypothetical protein
MYKRVYACRCHLIFELVLKKSPDLRCQGLCLKWPFENWTYPVCGSPLYLLVPLTCFLFTALLNQTDVIVTIQISFVLATEIKLNENRNNTKVQFLNVYKRSLVQFSDREPKTGQIVWILDHFYYLLLLWSEIWTVYIWFSGHVLITEPFKFWFWYSDRTVISSALRLPLGCSWYK